MAKSEKSLKSGFVIKLSCETVQKLSEERKDKNVESDLDTQKKEETAKLENKKLDENTPVQNKQDLEVSKHNKPQSINKSEADNATSKENTDKDSQESSWGDYAPYVTYEGEDAIYTDPTTQQKFLWNHETNAWDAKEVDVPGRVYSYEDDAHTYTEADGSKFFWDARKKAWLPKVDDDFLAYYQMSYGFVDNTTKDKNEEEDKDKEDKKKEGKKLEAGVKRKNDPQWFDQSEDKNTKVYVSNLPLDITEEEFIDLMQKCGLVERDLSTQKMKIKLYMDKEQNCFKGDALCTYIKIESVDLALKLLDGSDYKGNKIKVERAQFQLKGEYNPALKPKKKKKKELEKIKKMQQKLFDWRPEKFIGERSKHEKVVIVKNLFHPTDFDKDVQLILDYQQDLREECTKCGEVRKVVIYDRHPEGVAQVTMKEPEQADAVVALINGRWFGKRQITAEIWDGRTKYRIAETDADLNKRIEKWDNFLEGEVNKDGKKPPTPAADSKNSSSEEVPKKLDSEKNNETNVNTKDSDEPKTNTVEL
ncbi:17S U2 SnRNP complex component HTATSF1 [Epargyreus clarus]|uniref:17S U2 SnRNP complex component HTATSF1 n=1 Tax=Epargyreus clarus TaxID=520877 RepID=UPI003C30A4F0